MRAKATDENHKNHRESNHVESSFTTQNERTYLNVCSEVQIFMMLEEFLMKMQYFQKKR